MKKKISRLASLSLVLYIAASGVAAAQTTGASLNNPLSSQFSSISDFVAGALKIIVMIALPIIGFFIVVVGFKFISAQGNPGKIGKAKENAIYVLIGSALVLGAWVLATLLGATVSQLTG